MLRPDGIWTETFKVRSYETAPDGLASMQSLCNYLQEAAGNHADALGVSYDQMSAHRLAWVLTRLHVEVDAYPLWRETITVETWPAGHDGLYAHRHYLLYREDGTRFGVATSDWLLIDQDRRRPTRIPAFIDAIELPQQEAPLGPIFNRLPLPEAPDHGHRINVRYSDLDLNNHVNNVHYVEWTLETLRREVTAGYRLARLEVHFRAETLHGDTIDAQAEALPTDDDALCFAHRLTHTSDGRDAAQARTRWVPA